MKILYIANIRFPTEKAHALQIMQNCEAFVQAGCTVELWVTRRFNTPEMNAIKDVYAYYGVEPTFTIRRIPCLDLMPLIQYIPSLHLLLFYIQQFTFLMFLFIRVIFTQADIYYSRDIAPLAMIALVKDKTKLAYEAHILSVNRWGIWLQQWLTRKIGGTITITAKLKDDLVQRGTPAEKILVAHDGIRENRFANLPDQITAREKVGWRQTDFIIGYVGRLHTLGMDKGLGTVIEAISFLDNITLAIVGGPDEMAEELRDYWNLLGLDSKHFITSGHVRPSDVPIYLRAFDVCVMPHPFTPQFAYYTSPLKLFEYMAAEKPIIASDLPGWSDVITHKETAYLVPPSDVTAIRQAIQTLQQNVELRKTLAENAYRRVIENYTWRARAEHILQHLAQ